MNTRRYCASNALALPPRASRVNRRRYEIRFASLQLAVRGSNHATYYHNIDHYDKPAGRGEGKRSHDDEREGPRGEETEGARKRVLL